MSATRLAYLFELYIQRQITQGEVEELMKALENSANKKIFESLIDSYIINDNSEIKISNKKALGILNAIFKSDRITPQHIHEVEIPLALQTPDSDEKYGDLTYPISQPVNRIPILRITWFRYVAAILVIFGLGVYIYTSQNTKPLPKVATRFMMQEIPAPSSTRATITLADGQQIDINSATNGTLATQGKVDIRKMSDGSIVYNTKRESGSIQYNTFTVPRGSQIASIILSDGSKVFLNSASSLRYPVAFTGSTRAVEIIGEAYFEVARDPTKKFIVSGGGISAEVLGTHFNVNIYGDEENMKVTLLEGKIRVADNASHVVMAPGQQVSFDDGLMDVTSSVNIDQVMAWKNGLSSFNSANIKTIMRHVERWYDVEVEFEKIDMNRTFTGEIPRNIGLSEFLKLLAIIDIRFSIDASSKKILIRS